jgi:hypothetical protein
MPDFTLLRFDYCGRTFLNAYVGGHPSLVQSDALDSISSSTGVSGFGKFDIAGIDSNGQLFRDVLIRSLDVQEYPVYIHLWYTNANVKDAFIADKIINVSFNHRLRK